MYSKLPNKLRATATQFLVQRMLTDFDLASIAELQRLVEEKLEHDIFCLQEKKSGFWYKKRNGSAIEWQDKLTRLHRFYPASRNILDHHLFRILADGELLYRSVQWLELGEVYYLFSQLDEQINDAPFMRLFNKQYTTSTFTIFEKLLSHKGDDILTLLSETLIARNFLCSPQAVKINSYMIRCAWPQFIHSLGRANYQNHLNQQLQLFLNSTEKSN